jgi:uracil phosphoribosyltransferase
MSKVSHGKLLVFDHPLIHHKLTALRDASVDSGLFRHLLDEISMLMTYEVAKDLPTKEKHVLTPVATCVGQELATKICLVPILRAGLGMLNGILRLLPFAQVGHIGLARDEQLLIPSEYYVKLPHSLTDMLVVVIDPMLATGGSANAAIELLKKRGAVKIKLMSLLAVEEGIKAVRAAHPDVDLYVGAIDPILNENGYIVPGLGDAGDRVFNLSQ